MTERNNRAIEGRFDANLELEAALRAKGKHKQADMVHNILPSGVECIFVCQTEQLGLGHAILCAERVVGDELFAVLLADDFLTQPTVSAKFNVIEDLKIAFETSGQTQLSVMQVPGADIFPIWGDGTWRCARHCREYCGKAEFEEVPSGVASIGRYIHTPYIFDVLRDLPAGSGREIQLANGINIQAQQGKVNSVPSTELRFDCGSEEVFLAAISHVSSLRNS